MKSGPPALPPEHPVSPNGAPPSLDQTLYSVGAALLRAVTSTSSVLQAMGDELSSNGVGCAIFLLTEKSADALVVATLARPGEKAVVSQSLDPNSYHPVGYTVPVTRVATILQLISDDQPRYMPDTRSLILELAPMDRPGMTRQLIEVFGSRKALLAVISGSSNQLGVLVIAREDLSPTDFPVLTALSQKLSEAIQTARLFEEMRRALNRVKEQESYFRTLFETQPDAIILLDANLRIVTFNRSLIGLTRDDAIGKQITSVVPRDLVPQILPLLEQVKANGQPAQRVVRHQQKTGGTLWLDTRVIPVTDNRDQLSGIYVQNRDVTQRKLVELALGDSEKKYRHLLDNALVGVYQTSLDGTFLYANGETARIFEYESAHTLLAVRVLSIYRDPEQRADLLARLQTSGRVDNMELEIVTRTGSTRTVLFSGTMHNDIITGMLLDITERKAMQEKIVYDAVHDKLTGLPNRLEFLNRLDQSLWHSKRYSTYQFAVLLLDVDEFKLINDSLGHLVGDKLLVDIAERLKSTLRDGDFISRIGGDEFGVLLDDLEDINNTFINIHTFQRELAKPFTVDGHEIYVTASIGIALPRDDSDSPEDLLRNADTALYRAKAQGRGHQEVFDKQMHLHTLERLQLETDLRRALERNEFVVQYQPIVNLHEGTLAGFEALLRWKHPEKGLLNPIAFVPIAEDCGLVIPVDRWVFESACKQLKRWQDSYPSHQGIYVSINFSGRQFSQPDVIEMIRRVIEENGLEARRLKLEITESVLMDNPDNATSILSLLKLMEIQVDLDDFGTGYSSLSYLHRFPINRLKIDRSFVGRLEASEKDLAFVRTIVGLAHLLELKVVAEGVETPNQVERLKALNCEYAQGFFYAHPLDPEDAEELIRTDHHW